MSAGGVGQLPPCGFLVRATRGGILPLAIEKRAKGKKVTVISNVFGNAAALSSTLGRVLGAGGTVNPKGGHYEIEVQGEQLERVEKVLLQLGCTRGLAVSKETAEFVVERGDNDFMADGGPQPGRERRKPRHTGPHREEPPEDAYCRAWHGYWPYCSGCCEQPPKGLSEDVFWEADPGGKAPPAWQSAGCQARGGAQRAFAAPARSAAALDDALHRLGLLSRVGEAVMEWVRRQDQREAASVKRRLEPQAPVRVLGAVGTEGDHQCPECGVSFGAKATLKKHLAQHKRDREGVLMPVPTAGTVPDWRHSGVALEEYESGWDDHGPALRRGAAAYEFDYDDEPAPPVGGVDWRYAAPGERAGDDDLPTAPGASLGDFLFAAVGRGAPGGRGGSARQRPTAGPPKACPAAPAGGQQLAVCPVCGDRFPLATMDLHVDACLASGGCPQPLPPRTKAISSTSAPPKREPVGPPVGVGGRALPEDLLDALLDMDLPAASTASFWRRYEEKTTGRRMSPSDAFVAALEDALGSDDDEDEIDDGRRSTPPSHPSDGGVQVALAAMAGGRQQPVTPPAVLAAPLAASADGGQWQVAGRWRPGQKAASSCGTKAAKAPPPPPPPAAARTFVHVPPAAPRCEKRVQLPRATAPPLSYRDAADTLPGAAREISAWLQAALEPLVGADAAEAVAAGAEAVVANWRDDPDAAENVRELVDMELDGAGVCDGAAGSLRLELDSRMAVLA